MFATLAFVLISRSSRARRHRRQPLVPIPAAPKRLWLNGCSCFGSLVKCRRCARRFAVSELTGSNRPNGCNPLLRRAHCSNNEPTDRRRALLSFCRIRIWNREVIGTTRPNCHCGFMTTQHRPLGRLIVAHTAVGAILGVIAWIVITACADRGFGPFASSHDPIAGVVLLCTL